VKLLLMLKRNISLIVVALSFCVVVAWLLEDSTPEITMIENPSRALYVTVVTVQPGSAKIGLKAVGISRARWPVAVTATVSGHAEFVHEKLVPGKLVEKGTVLVKLADKGFRSDFTQAQAAVADAKLQLAQIQNEQHVAKQLGETSSAFGRREPHVRAAQAQLKAAMALVEATNRRLMDTAITTPFDAMLLSEQVSPGQWINAGDELYYIASSASIDIEVELSADQWQRLRHLNSDTWIEVTTPQGRIWDAKLRYLSPVMNATTRQRSLVLEVAAPYRQSQPLLPDQQVVVHFPGPEMSNVVRAPASALTVDGQVWTVYEGQLVLESIELLDESPELILFRYQQYPSYERQLVQFPLGTMLVGQRVRTRFDDAVSTEQQL